MFESFELKKETQSKDDVENKNPNNKNVDSLLYKKFNKKDHETSLIKIKEVEEKDRESEIVKERLKSIINNLDKGEYLTKVKISGEEHSFAIGEIFYNQKILTKEDFLEKNIENLDTSKISINFNLQNIEARQDNLKIQLKLSALDALKGGGSLKENLQKNIQNIFGGTIEYYKKNEVNNEVNKEKTSIESNKFKNKVNEVEKRAMELGLTERGAKIAILENSNKGMFTLMAVFPNLNSSAFVTIFGNKEPWYLKYVKNNNNKSISEKIGPPADILSELSKLTES